MYGKIGAREALADGYAWLPYWYLRRLPGPFHEDTMSDRRICAYLR